jgi:lysophospholipase L1-like esterase
MDGSLIIDEIAIPGITTGDLLSIVKRKLTSRYDSIFILCGTNDLGHGIQTKYIMQNLRKLYKVLAAFSSKVVGLTIPGTACKVKELIDARDQTNALIRKSAPSVLDFHNLIGDYNTTLWAPDGLHFSKLGYQRMAELIREM